MSKLIPTSAENTTKSKKGIDKFDINSKYNEIKRVLYFLIFFIFIVFLFINKYNKKVN